MDDPSTEADVMDRAQVLLRANLEVARGVDLEQVLHHLVDAARDLVGAECAALMVAQEGQPARVIRSPRDEPPAADGATARWPLLSVPIVLGGHVLGQLDLFGHPEQAAFTEQDGRMAATLAATAAVAIDNAALFEQVRRRHAWQEAMIGVTTRALSGVHTPALLRELVYHTWRASGADGAGLSLLSRRGRHVRLVVAMGVLAPFEQLSAPLEESFAHRAILLGRAFQTDPREHPVITAHVGGAEVGCVLVAPVLGARRAFGALTVARRKSTEPFEPIDQEMVGAFAAQAGLALEYDGAPVGRPQPARHGASGVSRWD
ncbi:hypothetical protein Cs7R123_42310 [Catellatospora sp. TT07R-123]|uniref:GAF domain-containing protein n=1 Tax=Catellatospora sp. TT07R-123 TaxID=2733863 RepID=UPI001B28C910|nr:GAF domain-containing protein [Catellatospora sp. TT07R-123]GHJ46889.1 hypothetical protein Cs7R123_42310 [Catellatospora sp. TT07R-123]